MTERNAHRHGRWAGLFKLTEECGELTAVLGGLAELGDERGTPEQVGALSDELADVGGAAWHVELANGLDLLRIEGRCQRQEQLLETDSLERAHWRGLPELVRRLGALVQVLAKISVFPWEDEHPDKAGSLTVRLETALADVWAGARFLARYNALDLDAIDGRAKAKQQLFASWTAEGTVL